MVTILDGIVVGGAGGAIAVLTVGVFQYVRDKVIQKKEINRIHTWLKENTENEPGKQFRSTRTIASWNNLTEDRVRYLCSTDDRIFLSTGEKEGIWSIHGRKFKTKVLI